MDSDVQPLTIDGVTYHFPKDAKPQEIADFLNAYHHPAPTSTGRTPANIGSIGPNAGVDYPISMSSKDTGLNVPIHVNLGNTPYGPAIPPSTGDSAIQTAGRFAANAMPAVGGAIATPESFGAMTPVGITAGSFIKRGLQAISPKYFGEGDPDTATDTATDIIGNSLPYGLSKIATGIADAAGIGRNQIAANILASKALRGTEPVQKAVRADIGDTVDAFTNNSFSQTTNPNLKATRTLFAKGASASGRLDADKILNEMKLNPDEYKAIPSDVQDSMKEFLNQAKEMQVNGTDGGLISMVKSKPVLAIPGMMAGSALGGLAGHGFVGATAGAAGGIILGEQAISKLMSNPEIARLTIQAMKTPATAESSKILSRVILNGLRGTEVMIMTPDGKQEKAEIDNQGRPTYLKPSN